MKKLVLVLLLLALIASPSALAGSAANNPDVRLDAVAAKIAGHPVSVYCEDDSTQWMYDALGYTSPWYDNIVYVHPWACDGLHKLLAHERMNTEVLPYNLAATAIHVLVHESVHQRGGVYADCYTLGPDDLACEGRTDCEALKLDRQAAIDLGIPAKIKGRVPKMKRLRNGDVLYYLVPGIVPNRALTILGNLQRMSHNASLPQYLGPCGKV